MGFANVKRLNLGPEVTKEQSNRSARCANVFVQKQGSSVARFFYSLYREGIACLHRGCAAQGEWAASKERRRPRHAATGTEWTETKRTNQRAAPVCALATLCQHTRYVLRKEKESGSRSRTFRLLVCNARSSAPVVHEFENRRESRCGITKPCYAPRYPHQLSHFCRAHKGPQAATCGM